MHIILAFLGAIITILILFKRLSDAGIDITWLNPFAWHRRRSWRKKYDKKPLYTISDPMDMAALLMTAIAKADGDMSHEEKLKILSLFQSEFNQSERDASDLLKASVFLFSDGSEIQEHLEKICSASLENFTEEQAQSVISLLKQICEIDVAQRDVKESFIRRVEKIYVKHFKPKEKWG